MFTEDPRVEMAREFHNATWNIDWPHHDSIHSLARHTRLMLASLAALKFNTPDTYEAVLQEALLQAHTMGVDVGLSIEPTEEQLAKAREFQESEEFKLLVQNANNKFNLYFARTRLASALKQRLADEVTEIIHATQPDETHHTLVCTWCGYGDVTERWDDNDLDRRMLARAFADFQAKHVECVK